MKKISHIQTAALALAFSLIPAFLLAGDNFSVTQSAGKHSLEGSELGIAYQFNPLTPLKFKATGPGQLELIFYKNYGPKDNAKKIAANASVAVYEGSKKIKELTFKGAKEKNLKYSDAADVLPSKGKSLKIDLSSSEKEYGVTVASGGEDGIGVVINFIAPPAPKQQSDAVPLVPLVPLIPLIPSDNPTDKKVEAAKDAPKETPKEISKATENVQKPEDKKKTDAKSLESDVPIVPILDVKPETKTEPKAEKKVESKIEQKAEPKTEQKVEPKVEPKNEVKPIDKPVDKAKETKDVKKENVANAIPLVPIDDDKKPKIDEEKPETIEEKETQPGEKKSFNFLITPFAGVNMPLLTDQGVIVSYVAGIDLHYILPLPVVEDMFAVGLSFAYSGYDFSTQVPLSNVLADADVKLNTMFFMFDIKAIPYQNEYITAFADVGLGLALDGAELDLFKGIQRENIAHYEWKNKRSFTFGLGAGAMFKVSKVAFNYDLFDAGLMVNYRWSQINYKTDQDINGKTSEYEIIKNADHGGLAIQLMLQLKF